jgi:hypothetical protein
MKCASEQTAACAPVPIGTSAAVGATGARCPNAVGAIRRGAESEILEDPPEAREPASGYPRLGSTSTEKAR